MGRVSAQPSSSGGQPIASAVSDLPGGRPHLRRSLIVLLVVVNATWSGLCVFTAAVLAGTASMFGLTHLVGEGVAGVLTVVPVLAVMGIGFRLGEMVWGVWLGIVWFRGSRSAAARTVRTFFAVRFGKRVATTQDRTPTRGES